VIWLPHGPVGCCGASLFKGYPRREYVATIKSNLVVLNWKIPKLCHIISIIAG